MDITDHCANAKVKIPPEPARTTYNLLAGLNVHRLDEALALASPLLSAAKIHFAHFDGRGILLVDRASILDAREE